MRLLLVMFALGCGLPSVARGQDGQGDPPLVRIEHTPPGAVAPPADIDLDEDFAPALFVALVAFIAIVHFVAVVLVVVGTASLAALLAIAVGIAAGAVFLGLTTSAAAVGAARRSVGAGLETLLAQCGALAGVPAGVPAGVAAAWMAHHLAASQLDVHVSRPLCPVLGGLSGVAVGAAMGLVLGRSLRVIAGRLHPSRD